jgi:hypothetical protein
MKASSVARVAVDASAGEPSCGAAGLGSGRPLTRVSCTTG